MLFDDLLSMKGSHVSFILYNENCLDVLKRLEDNSLDSIVTDPPYGLSFMGKKWDYDVPSVEIWAECLRVLKPGGHLLAFAGTRTQHRMAVRIEDAGFEIRDMIAWVYGSGFPKSHDVSKGIDKRGGESVAWFGPWFRKWREENGVTQKQVAALFLSKTGGLTGCVANWELGLNMPTVEQFNLIRDTFGLPFESIEAAQREVVGQRTTGIGTGGGSTPIMGDGSRDITAPATEAAKQWEGWGTALKPALEPITVARKPLMGTVAENVLEHGTGGLNIDGCRVVGETRPVMVRTQTLVTASSTENPTSGATSSGEVTNLGRWPANLIHDGSDEVVGLFPTTGGGGKPQQRDRAISSVPYTGAHRPEYTPYQDTATGGGSAARFFYCAKSSKRDRDEGLEGLPLHDVYSEAAATPMRDQREQAKRANHHPTVKPTNLMRYLCRLVTPPGGVVLDPFMGSGSTGKAAMIEGFQFIGCEMSPEYFEIAKARIEAAKTEPTQKDMFVIPK
jgi:DNA modification methylase